MTPYTLRNGSLTSGPFERSLLALAPWASKSISPLRKVERTLRSDVILTPNPLKYRRACFHFSTTSYIIGEYLTVQVVHGETGNKMFQLQKKISCLLNQNVNVRILAKSALNL